MVQADKGKKRKGTLLIKASRLRHDNEVVWWTEICLGSGLSQLGNLPEAFFFPSCLNSVLA